MRAEKFTTSSRSKRALASMFSLVETARDSKVEVEAHIMAVAADTKVFGS